MRPYLVLVAAVAALSACDSGAPAGGQGYFDPPPRAPLAPSYPTYPDSQVSPSGTYTAPQPQASVENAPRSAVSVNPDPNAQLAQDVTEVLRSTAPTGGATTARTQPGQPADVTGGGTGTQAVAGALPATPGTGAMPGAEDIGIDPNSESINLSLSTQEEQKRQREAAERRRQAAQSQLVVIDPEPVPQQDINANVVAFARETSHPVGTKVYNRPVFRNRMQSASVCRRFESNEEAQRQFLANGGPNTDRYNLDPDGDGFACDFDPEKYRRLNF